MVDGQLCIPVIFNEQKNIFECIGYTSSSDKSPRRYTFPACTYTHDLYKLMEYINKVVIGPSGGMVQVVDVLSNLDNDECGIYCFPKFLPKESLQSLFENYTPHIHNRKVKLQVTSINSQMSWHKFNGWMYSHWWEQKFNSSHPRIVSRSV